MAPPRAGFVPEDAAKPRCCTARIILQQRRIPRLTRADPSKAMPVLHSLVHQLSEDVSPTIMPVLHSLAPPHHISVARASAAQPGSAASSNVCGAVREHKNQAKRSKAKCRRCSFRSPPMQTFRNCIALFEVLGLSGLKSSGLVFPENYCNSC